MRQSRKKGGDIFTYKNDALPSSARKTSDVAPDLAKDLPATANEIRRDRKPEFEEIDLMADIIAAAGHYRASELTDTSAQERAEFCKLLSAERPGYARLLRKTLDYKGPATEVATKRGPPYQEVDIRAAKRARECTLEGIGEILTTRREAARFFPEALFGGE